MNRLVRAVVACVLCGLILHFMAASHLYVGSMVLAGMVAGIVYGLVFPGGKQRTPAVKQERRERILNLQNGSMGEVFLPARYPGYKKMRTGSDGNDYLSPSGEIICTKYETVTVAAPVRREGTTGRHILCILLIGAIFLYITQSPDLSPLLLSKTGRAVSTSYVGVMADQAASELERDGWEVEIREGDYDPGKETGTVLSQQIDLQKERVTLYVNQPQAQAGGAGAYVEADRGQAVVQVGKTATIFLTCSGELPDSYSLSCQEPENVEVAWGEWQETTVSLQLTGTAAGSAELVIQLKDSATETVLANCRVSLTVE